MQSDFDRAAHILFFIYFPLFVWSFFFLFVSWMRARQGANRVTPWVVSKVDKSISKRIIFGRTKKTGAKGNRVTPWVVSKIDKSILYSGRESCHSLGR